MKFNYSFRLKKSNCTYGDIEVDDYVTVVGIPGFVRVTRKNLHGFHGTGRDDLKVAASYDIITERLRRGRD